MRCSDLVFMGIIKMHTEFLLGGEGSLKERDSMKDIQG
jgi:hypothetical protein